MDAAEAEQGFWYLMEPNDYDYLSVFAIIVPVLRSVPQPVSPLVLRVGNRMGRQSKVHEAYQQNSANRSAKIKELVQEVKKDQ